MKLIKNLKTNYWRFIIIVIPMVLLIFALFFSFFKWKLRLDTSGELAIRSAVAEKLNSFSTSIEIKPNELTDENFAKIVLMSLEVSEGSRISLLEKFTKLQQLRLTINNYPESKIPKWMKILEKYGILDTHQIFQVDLSPLEKLPNLKDFQLFSKTNNIQPISGLINLQKLELRTQASDMKPLEGLINLQELLISSQASDILPLVELINLQKLSLSGPNLSNLEPLMRLPNLKYLYIYNCEKIEEKQIDNLKNAMPSLIISNVFPDY
jgi:internalin A